MTHIPAVAVAEPPPAAPVHDPIDWALAERVARRFSGREPLAASYLAGSLRDDFDAVTAEAESLVADYTGLRSPGPARAQVVDRASWVVGQRRVDAPPARAAHRAGRRTHGRQPGRADRPSGRGHRDRACCSATSRQRVLGQYDLLVLDDDAAADAVYYVGGNILALEKRFAFRPRDFRLWIAIHEVTHRAQFTGVPWMKPYYLSLVESTLSSIDPDPRRLMQALARAVEEFRSGRNPLDDGGLVALLASDEQRGALANVQALMSLLEGHGNSVMNQLGREHVAGQARMARVLHARRQSAGMAALLQKLVGLESKMRQYEVGETFIAAVEREAGPARHRRRVAGPGVPAHHRRTQPSERLARPGRRRDVIPATASAVDPLAPVARTVRDRGARLVAPVVVGCSGGADSVALLALAVDAGLAPVAVHVDHGLRPGSGDEATAVGAIAAQLGADGPGGAGAGDRGRQPGGARPGGPVRSARAGPRRARRRGGDDRPHHRRPGRDRPAQCAAGFGGFRARGDGAAARAPRATAARYRREPTPRALRGAGLTR